MKLGGKNSFKFEGGEIEHKPKVDLTLYGEEVNQDETGYSEKTCLGGLLSVIIGVFIGYFIFNKGTLILDNENDIFLSTSYVEKKHLVDNILNLNQHNASINFAIGLYPKGC